MTKRQLLFIIGGLILVNLITVGILVIKSKNSIGSSRETVATIGKHKVTKLEWYDQLEAEYGKEILEKLIDEKVILQLAEKYNVHISADYLDKEFTMLKALYHVNNDGEFSESDWKEQLRLSMLLEELLTLDVIISDEELQRYYEKNINKYRIKPAFNISQIVVATEEEAERINKELQNGASFSTLAMEVSLDEFTANEGGELGFINEDDERFSDEFLNEVSTLNVGEWSKPLRTDDGYVLIKVNDRIEGENYSLNDVKDQIRRKVALEQMDTFVSTKPFWDELQVDWIYNEAN